MVLDLKILACMAFFVVMVHGRAGDPSNARREMLLKVLSQLKDERYGPPPQQRSQYYQRDGETGDQTEDQPTPAPLEADDAPTTEATVEENNDDTANEDVADVVAGLQVLAGEECGSVLDGLNSGEEFDPVTFFTDLSSRAIDVYECLVYGNTDENNMSFDSEDMPDLDDDETEEFAEETGDDGPGETTEETEESVESTTEAPEPTTLASVESDDEAGETVEAIEKELLKDMLKERILSLSRKGYNGKK